MKFLFSSSTRHLTRSLRSLVSYWVEHSKRRHILMWSQSLLFYQREGKEHVEEKIIHSIMRINSQDRIGDSPYCLP